MNKRIEYIARSFALESVKPGWKEHIFDELKESYFLDMLSYLDGQYMKYTVYPPKEKVFEIFPRLKFQFSLKLLSLAFLHCFRKV